MTHTVTVTDDQLATIVEALDYYGGWAREGRSDTDDPYYLEVLGKIDDALAALRAAQPGTEPHNGVWTEQAVRNALGEPINGRDDNSWVDYELAYNLATRIIGHYETWIANARLLLLAQEQDAQPGTTDERQRPT